MGLAYIESADPANLPMAKEIIIMRSPAAGIREPSAPVRHLYR